METDATLWDGLKTLLLGTVLTIGGILFWYHFVGNPLDELALIRRSQVATGILVETTEEEVEDEHGVGVLNVGLYSFGVPDGREFKTVHKVSADKTLAERCDIEYLPDDPDVCRIKGEGNQSIIEWLLIKIGVGGLLLVMFLTPGVPMMRSGLLHMKLYVRSQVS